MSHIIISGAAGNSPRREIHDLVKDQTQFSLYVQALREFRLVLSPS
jgi:hypothetical protein